MKITPHLEGHFCAKSIVPKKYNVFVKDEIQHLNVTKDQWCTKRSLPKPGAAISK